MCATGATLWALVEVFFPHCWSAISVSSSLPGPLPAPLSVSESTVFGRSDLFPTCLFQSLTLNTPIGGDAKRIGQSLQEASTVIQGHDQFLGVSLCCYGRHCVSQQEVVVGLPGRNLHPTRYRWELHGTVQGIVGIVGGKLYVQAKIKEPVLIRQTRSPHLFCFFTVHAPTPTSFRGCSMDSEVIPNTSNLYPKPCLLLVTDPTWVKLWNQETADSFSAFEILVFVDDPTDGENTNGEGSGQVKCTPWELGLQMPP